MFACWVKVSLRMTKKDDERMQNYQHNKEYKGDEIIIMLPVLSVSTTSISGLVPHATSSWLEYYS